MKSARTCWRILAFLLLAGLSATHFAQAGTEEKKKPKGPYLGQTPPGTTPVLFASSFLKATAFACTFTPDGKEFYYTRMAGGRNYVYVSQETSKGWTKPKKASFNTGLGDAEPHITADGTQLYWSSGRLGPDGSYGMWVMDRVGTGWGEPRFFGPSLMYITTARNKNLYVTDMSDLELQKIAVRRFENGQYGPLELLGEGINDGTPAVHPCIAWDESYLIFDGPRPDALGGPGDWDCYISFRNPDGSWTQAAHFLEISSPDVEMCTSLSPDGKYLFFGRSGPSGSHIWWVSSEILERYRPAGVAGKP
jgi:hypothetical protein